MPHTGQVLGAGGPGDISPVDTEAINALESFNQQIRDLEFQREQAIARFEGRETGLQTVTSPTGQTFIQAPGGALIPTAPSFQDLFDVSEEEATAQAAPLLQALEERRAVVAPREARQATLDPLSRGFGVTGGMARGEAERATARVETRFAEQRGSILGQATRDILFEREARERQRQGLMGIAQREVEERERGARFDIGLSLGEFGRREDILISGEEARRSRDLEERAILNAQDLAREERRAISAARPRSNLANLFGTF